MLLDEILTATGRQTEQVQVSADKAQISVTAVAEEKIEISASAFPSKKRGVVSRSGRVKIDVDEPPRDLTGRGEKRIKRVVPFHR